MSLDPLPPESSAVTGVHPTPREDIPRSGRMRRLAIAPLSLALILISVGVAIYSNLGDDTKSLFPLFITAYAAAPAPLWEIRHGEVWRLITPIFIHFSILHLVFNMLWVKDLGTAIERRHGTWFLLILTLSLAIASNLGQYFVNGPAFGGMSGVVYGFFGYVWLRGVTDPASGFHVPAQTVLVMLGWFVLCWLRVIPNVANTAHGVGLVIGAGWGAACGLAWPSAAIYAPSRPEN